MCECSKLRCLVRTIGNIVSSVHHSLHRYIVTIAIASSFQSLFHACIHQSCLQIASHTRVLKTWWNDNVMAMEKRSAILRLTLIEHHMKHHFLHSENNLTSHPPSKQTRTYVHPQTTRLMNMIVMLLIHLWIWSLYTWFCYKLGSSNLFWFL